MNVIRDNIFSIKTKESFEAMALAVFRHQAQNCSVYQQFIGHLKINIDEITAIEKIPFLPINFFKNHRVVSNQKPAAIVFSSSGTTGMQQSKHFVSDISLYQQSYRQAFNRFYGEINDYCFLALLPSYQERSGSSLIYMVDDLISLSKHPQSGYFLHNHDDLYKTLQSLKAAKQKTVLIGVTYALLDFIEKHQLDFPDLIVMETGGMKGRRKEMIREELHCILAKGFGVSAIHSEYGMTELLSQAYALGDGIFKCPPWMKILIRDTNDPLALSENGKAGGINVIDLANINACAFIATQDLGKLKENNDFEVLGRFDNSDLRGCNLMVQ